MLKQPQRTWATREHHNSKHHKRKQPKLNEDNEYTRNGEHTPKAEPSITNNRGEAKLTSNAIKNMKTKIRYVRTYETDIQPQIRVALASQTHVHANAGFHIEGARKTKGMGEWGQKTARPSNRRISFFLSKACSSVLGLKIIRKNIYIKKVSIYGLGSFGSCDCVEDIARRNQRWKRSTTIITTYSLQPNWNNYNT